MPLRDTDDSGETKADSVFDLINNPEFIELSQEDRADLRRKAEKSPKQQQQVSGWLGMGGFQNPQLQSDSEFLQAIEDTTIVDLEKKVDSLEDGEVSKERERLALEEVWLSLQLLKQKRGETDEALVWLQCRYHEIKSND